MELREVRIVCRRPSRVCQQALQERDRRVFQGTKGKPLSLHAFWPLGSCPVFLQQLNLLLNFK